MRDLSFAFPAPLQAEAFHYDEHGIRFDDHVYDDAFVLDLDSEPEDAVLVLVEIATPDWRPLVELGEGEVLVTIGEQTVRQVRLAEADQHHGLISFYISRDRNTRLWSVRIAGESVPEFFLN